MSTPEGLARVERSAQFVEKVLALAATQDLDVDIVCFEFVRHALAVLYRLNPDELTGSVRKMLLEFEKQRQ